MLLRIAEQSGNISNRDGDSYENVKKAMGRLFKRSLT